MYIIIILSTCHYIWYFLEHYSHHFPSFCVEKLYTLAETKDKRKTRKTEAKIFERRMEEDGTISYDFSCYHESFGKLSACSRMRSFLLCFVFAVCFSLALDLLCVASVVV